MGKHKTVERACPCGQTFRARIADVKRGEGRFCSKPCGATDWGKPSIAPKSLASRRIGEVRPTPKKALGERFIRYHAQNPQIYGLFVRFANEAFQAGHQRIGAKLLIERLRWESLVRAEGQPLKVDNSFVSRYTRLLIKDRPHLATLFATRSLRS